MGAGQEFLSSDDEQFASFFQADARLEQIATGFIWAEGPVWINETQELRFSDIPNNRMMSLVTG